ncbi:hypothetical protein WG915_03860 [Corynebacterium sp. H128]|uniref:hypothetical protein n=1 Tax=Corynebacterium sp. H128 TaxID=3133427 RepID=UPI0030A3146D
MTEGRLDERQLQVRGRIAHMSLAFALIFLLVLSLIAEFVGEWITPTSLAITVLYASLGFHTIACIVSDAYLPPGTNMSRMKFLVGFLILLLLLNSIIVVRAVSRGRFLEDGQLDNVWTQLVLTIVLAAVLATSGWKRWKRAEASPGN